MDKFGPPRRAANATRAGFFYGEDFEALVASDCPLLADDAKLVRTTFYVMRVATSYAEWEDRDRGRLRRWWRARDASPRLKARDREALAAYLACLDDDDDTRRLGET